MFYERRNDPTFDGTVRFISGVPLISADPACLATSQYATSILLWARQSAIARFHAQISDACRTALRADPGENAPTRKFRTEVFENVHTRAFGRDEILTHALFEDPSQQRPQSAADAIRVPSRSEVTTGLHVLRRVDPIIRHSAGIEGIRELLETGAVRWRLLQRSQVSSARGQKFIDAGVPFLLHQNNDELLVCGYATHSNTVYWLSYDLAKLERRVTLGYTSGSVPFSRYLELVAENRKRDQPLEIDPLFWDYQSYFSIQNLSAFRLQPAKEEESVSAVYSDGVDEARLQLIIDEELTNARDRQAQIDAENQAIRESARHRPHTEE